MAVQVKFAKVRDTGVTPSKRDEDAGYDIYCSSDDDIVIKPLDTVNIPTGIASAIPSDYYFQIQERGSTGSIGMKYGAGCVDSGYRGEWFVPITNTSTRDIIITNSVNDTVIDEDKVLYPMSKGICQAVLLPVPRTVVEEISLEELQAIPSERGDGALGSSGK